TRQELASYLLASDDISFLQREANGPPHDLTYRRAVAHGYLERFLNFNSADSAIYPDQVFYAAKFYAPLARELVHDLLPTPQGDLFAWPLSSGQLIGNIPEFIAGSGLTIPFATVLDRYDTDETGPFLRGFRVRGFTE